MVVAHSDYVGLFGNPEITLDPGFLLPVSTNPERSPAHQGMFYRNSHVKIADVTDGTSQTTFCGRAVQQSRLCNVDGIGDRWLGAAERSPTLTAIRQRGAPVLILGHTGDVDDDPAAHAQQFGYPR